MVPAVGAHDAMRVDVEGGCEVIETKVARPLQPEQIFDTDEDALGLVKTTAGLCLGEAKLPGDRVVLQIEVEPSGAFSLVREKSTIPHELRPCIDKALGSASVRPSGFRRELTATLVLEPTEPPESSDTAGDPDEPTAPDGASNPALSREEVVAVINSAEAEALACFGEEPQSSFTLRLQINGDGSAIYLGTEPPASAEAAGCLRRLINDLRFRATGASPLNVNSPPIEAEREEVEDEPGGHAE